MENKEKIIVEVMAWVSVITLVTSLIIIITHL